MAIPRDKLQQDHRVPAAADVRPLLDRARRALRADASDDDLPDGRPLGEGDDDLDVTAVFLR